MAYPTEAHLRKEREEQRRFIAERGWRRSRDEWRDPISDHTCPLAQAVAVEQLRDRKRIVAQATGLDIPADEPRGTLVVVDGREMTLGEAMELLAPEGGE